MQGEQSYPLDRPHAGAAVAARVRGVLSAVEPDWAIVTVAAAYAGALVARLPAQVNQDTWLALVSGREVLRHGLPHTNTLTLWAHGVTWVDQQWLGQLVLYGAFSLGGLVLAALLHALTTAGAFSMALVQSRRIGASPRAVLLVAVPCAFLLVWSSWQVRAQSLVYPLFVALLGVLLADARSPSRRVLLALPILVLWANLHGSVLVGVGLVVLRGAFLLRAAPLRAGLLLAAAPCSVLASPYGTDLLGYYDRVLLSSGFGAVVPEWAPIELGVVSLPFFALAAITVWALGRRPRALGAFEWSVLGATAAAPFLEVRNVPWFALTALTLLPRATDGLLLPRTSAPSSRLNRLVMVVSIASVIVLVGAALTRGDAWIREDYPDGVAAAIERSAGGQPPAVFADVRYANWLLWTNPRLSGHLSYDARFELLAREDLFRLLALRNGSLSEWPAAVRGYSILVLDRRREPQAVRFFLRERRGHAEYDDGRIVVVART
jgi:hypothetical protein